MQPYICMVASAAPLTPSETRVLQALERRSQDALPPTLRELAAELGWRSVASVREYLQRLQAKGMVWVVPGRARAIQLTDTGRSLVQSRQAGVLPPASLGGPQAVMKLLEGHTTSEVLAKGRVLWLEGDTADRLVQVEHGLLRAFRSWEDGRTTTLLRFGPGDVLGFAPFFDAGGYPGSVEAVEPSRVRVVHRRDLEVALRDPRLALALMALLARRLREAFDLIEQLSIRSALNRVASALERLVPGGPFPIVSLQGTAKAFAEAIGLTAASLSRALAELVHKGVLHRLGSGKYQVIRLEALRKLASGSENDRT